MNTISILIPIHNRINVTQQGLNSLYKSLNYYLLNERKATCKFQIVVIDDGSTDGSSEWIKSNYPHIHIIEGDGNLWWSGAINLGAEFSINILKSNYLLLWNDDITPHKEYFFQLQEMIKKSDLQNSIVGSRIMVHQRPNLVWSNGGLFDKVSGQLGMCDKELKTTDQVYECDWQPGMGTLIPSIVIINHKIWWNNKKFPQYHGDSDFVLRCKKQGVKVCTNLNLIIYNKTELTGLTRKKSIKDLYKGLTSTRSFYNLYRDVLFYTDHGTIPFAYYSLIKKYFFYIGGYIKHSIKSL